jgi:hypothetical protein
MWMMDDCLESLNDGCVCQLTETVRQYTCFDWKMRWKEELNSKIH